MILKLPKILLSLAYRTVTDGSTEGRESEDKAAQENPVKVPISLGRSLSTTAERLGRRVSSILSFRTPCAFCRDLDIQAADFLCKTADTQLIDGVVIAAIPDSWQPSANRECSLCQILSTVYIDSINPERTLPLELRAFPIASHIAWQSTCNSVPSAWELIRTQFSIDSQTEFFLAIVPTQYTRIFQKGITHSTVGSLVSERGFLTWRREVSPSLPQRLFLPSVVSPHFNPKVVRGWLDCCQRRHEDCRRHSHVRNIASNLQLIDCETRGVVDASTLLSSSSSSYSSSIWNAFEYVALSYVWGSKGDTTKNNRNMGKISSGKQPRLPERVSQVINDAIAATQALGYRYIWIDKYCVDQQDSNKKHQQIMHMDSVYQNAALTIIAAAGEDETYGLPGISRTRPIKQVFFEGDKFTLTSSLPSPREEIANSLWATRGWTYQEAMLSTRRLVFTDQQLYFECNTASWYESMQISFDEYNAQPKLHPYLEDFMRPALFSNIKAQVKGNEVSRRGNFSVYTRCAEEYSKRHLSYDQDSLNAFGGIIKRLESVNRFPVQHIWGVPFFYPEDSNKHSDIHDRGYVDYLGWLMAGLSWRHDPSFSSTCPRRRKGLPSWSWVGWEGAVFWPKTEAAWKIQGNDFFRPLNSQSASCRDVFIQLVDESRKSFPDFGVNQNSGKDVGTYFPKALVIKTSPLPRSVFLSASACSNPVGTNSCLILTMANGVQAKAYLSKSGRSASTLLNKLRNGRYDAIRLGVVDDEAFWMIIKPKRHAAYRVGILVMKEVDMGFQVSNETIRKFRLK